MRRFLDRFPFPPRQAALVACAGLSLLAATGCSRILNGPPSAHDVVERPTAILDWNDLYSKNCAACHGQDGKGGPAPDLNNPIYLALVSDDTLRGYVTNGGPGSQMPGFGTTAGGLLTSEQINVIVQGIRQRWAKPAMFQGMTLPAYSASHAGDPTAGLAVYNQACARCHGEAQPDGSVPKPGKAGSLVDPVFLSLVSDQNLRTTILAGRPDLGMPNYQNDLSGQPLTDAQITDVVAWLTSHRPADAADVNVKPLSGPDQAAVDKAAVQIQQEKANAAKNPSQHDKGGEPEPSKAKRAKDAENAGGMIRTEGR